MQFSYLASLCAVTLRESCIFNFKTPQSARVPLILLISKLLVAFLLMSAPLSALRNARRVCQGRGVHSNGYGYGLIRNSIVRNKSAKLWCTNAPHPQQREHYTDSIIDADINRLRGKRITDYWLNELKKLDRPSARALISQLNADTPLGFEPATGPARKGTLLDFTIQQKVEHEDKVILIRNGEFYETYGVDALMLINYCGLNPMANKPKAGCPLRNVQQTLDGLTQAGLSAAVYEEVSEIALAKGSVSPTVAKSKIKHRILTQIVSPASTTYAYDLCLRSENIDYRANKPIMAIMHTVSGYSLYEIWLDEKRISVSQRLTLEAVRTIVEQYGHVEPAYVFDSTANVRSMPSAKRSVISLTALPFLSSVETIEGVPDEASCIEQVLRRISRRFEVDTSEFRWHQTVSSTDRPRSVYTSTALQIGLFENPNVPDLVPHLLPPIHHAHSAKFLKNWILHPPSKQLADHMRRLCAGLVQLSVSLPPFTPIPVGKLVSLLYAKQANLNMLREIRQSVSGVLHMLSRSEYGPIVDSLFELTASEVGSFKFSQPTIMESCSKIISLIDSVIYADVSDFGDVGFEDKVSVDPHQRIPDDFFVRNEETFRSKVVSTIPEVKELYDQIQKAASELTEAVNNDFPKEAEVVFDIFNNAVMLRDVLTARSASASTRKNATANQVSADTPVLDRTKYIPYIDRKGAVVSKRYTTKRVQEALAAYQSVVETAPDVITSILQQLCEKLVSDLMTVIFASHWAIILTAINAHVGISLQQQWTLAEPLSTSTADAEEKEPLQTPNEMILEGLTPYWLSRSMAVRNDVNMTGLFLLTAPNMSGKSTLMRAILSAALLGNCGLFVPASRACIPRYDNFFLRSASYDIPKEGKSAFALEMDDVRVLLRDCTNRSLVMLDEIGKGTSARDGAALAGALLEHLDRVGVSGVFATHLHELFRLPVRLSERVHKKRMGVIVNDSDTCKDDPIWTFQLEDGACLDSMALHTARAYGIEDDVLVRAAQLGADYDDLWKPRTEDGCSAECGDDKGDLVSINDRESEVTSANQNVVAGSPSANVGKHRRYSLEEDILPVAVDLMERMNLTLALPAGALTPQQLGAVIVDNAWDPPPVLEGSHVVYVLQLIRGNLPDEIYVGETASIRQRLYQHRQRFKTKQNNGTGRGGTNVRIRALALPLPDKSKAQHLETTLIARLKADGVDIVHDRDQRHRHFSAEQS